MKKLNGKSVANLNSKLSPPRRGRIFVCPLVDARGGICRTLARKTSSVRWPFLLPGGEGQDEGERKTNFPI